MRCISPVLIRRSGRRDYVPCGKCNFCLGARRADWTFRVLQEYAVSSSAYFLTLTYADEKLPAGGSLCVEDWQLFMKRLRHKCREKLRYYSVGEYGTETDRPHYHSIMFNLPESKISSIDGVWDKGLVHVGNVTEASVGYVTKYVVNRHREYGGREPPFAVMSRRPGLGAAYLEKFTRWHREGMRNFTQVHGKVGRLPRFYKERIFSDIERQRLALESVELADAAYIDAVGKLSRFHLDPYAYYDERIAYSHEVAFSKLNEKNLI